MRYLHIFAYIPVGPASGCSVNVRVNNEDERTAFYACSSAMKKNLKCIKI